MRGVYRGYAGCRGGGAVDRVRQFKRGYLIVDRVGVRIVRDCYSAKPYVLFYTTKRSAAGCRTSTQSSC